MKGILQCLLLRKIKDDCLCLQSALICTGKEPQSTEWHFWGINILRNSDFPSAQLNCSVAEHQVQLLIDWYILAI